MIAIVQGHFSKCFLQTVIRQPLLKLLPSSNAVSELDTHTAPSTDGSSRKHKITNLLRNLSASAASSSARMTPRSTGSGDRKLMVEVQEQCDEPDADEIPDSPPTGTPEAEEPAARSSVRKVFSITSKRASGSTTSGSLAARGLSKYSQISDD